MYFVRRLRKILTTALPLIACIALGCGCMTSTPGQSWSEQQAAALRKELLKLSDRVNQEDAARLADAAIQKSLGLAREYRLVWPPWLHNNLVNLKLRERGLCYDWANDLFPTLHELRVRTLELHLAVARMDTRREHNALVVTAPGQPFCEGLVLDAWRHSGRLWWGRADTDKYPWQPLPSDRMAPELQTLLRNESVPKQIP